jgi:hypothetical protein
MDHTADKGPERPTLGGEAPVGDAALPSPTEPWRAGDALVQNLAARILEVAESVAASLKIPVAFAEGFLRSLLSIESVEEDASGRVIIRPKPGASEEDIMREVDEIAARIDPTSVYNPVARRSMDSVVEASNAVMREDLHALADLTPEELHSTLSRLEPDPPVVSEEARSAAEEVRARMDEVRAALRKYQAGYANTHVIIDNEDDQGSE